MYHVGKDGWTKVSGDDVGELHYKYYPVPDPKQEAEARMETEATTETKAAEEKDTSEMKD